MSGTARKTKTPLLFAQLHEASFEELIEAIRPLDEVRTHCSDRARGDQTVLEFKILSDINIGEMWVDDVSIEPLGITGSGGP